MEVSIYHLPDGLDPPLPPAFLAHHRALSLGSDTPPVHRQEGCYHPDNEGNLAYRLQVRHMYLIAPFEFLAVRPHPQNLKIRQTVSHPCTNHTGSQRQWRLD